MQRCPREHADARLDTWGWRCAQLDEAQTIHRTLAGSTGATWPDWSATVHRPAREAASEEMPSIKSPSLAMTNVR